VIRSLLAGGLVAGSALVMHPLGNFTVNQYDGLMAARTSYASTTCRTWRRYRPPRCWKAGPT